MEKAAGSSLSCLPLPNFDTSLESSFQLPLPSCVYTCPRTSSQRIEFLIIREVPICQHPLAVIQFFRSSSFPSKLQSRFLLPNLLLFVIVLNVKGMFNTIKKSHLCSHL
jgi:hypothetical protein